MSTCAIRGGAPLPFELLEPLGEGRWGRVYRARDCRTGRCIAVKTTDEAGATELAHGFAVLSALCHPNLLEVHELFDTVEGRAMSMALVLPGSLDPAQSDAGLSAHELAIVIADLARGLDHLHQAGWVHRDVKPANVLWDGHRARLADLGLAVPSEPGGMTAPAGTPPYMAPEVFLRWRVGPASDWFALGVTAWELLTGDLPYDAPSLQEELLAKQRHTPGVLPSGVDRSRWEPLLRGLLDPDPDRRWDGARVLEHLDGVTPGAGGCRGGP